MVQTTQTVYVTGATGYIGSHVCVELLSAGHRVVGVDNLSNSSVDVVERIGRVAGSTLTFERLDLRDAAAVEASLRRHGPDAVVHLAGLKAVAESVVHPDRYYTGNVGAAINLLSGMRAAAVQRIVFSSSCTVYGEPAAPRVDEDSPIAPINPYGRSKAMIEQMLTDTANADMDFRPLSLRYFNPVGAHESGLIGEEPRGTPNNLMPLVLDVACGLRPHVEIFGIDYGTDDGTCERDYIHVTDLAAAHVHALDYLGASAPGQARALNLGTGRPYSVIEVIEMARSVSGQRIPAVEAPRRPGDAERVYADPLLAEQLLDWRATRDLEQMCRDHWRWHSSRHRRAAVA